MCGLPGEFSIQPSGDKPVPGDFAVARVERVGHHHFIETDSGRRLRLYPADRVACAFGNRYATDVYEGRALDLNRLHLLSGSGVIGTVLSQNHDAGPPTRLSFLGYVTDAAGKRVNSVDRKFSPAPARPRGVDVIVIAGTGMSTGKTTVVRRILYGLSLRGVRAAGCKLTGTTSPRDLHEMRSAGAAFTTDFSDFGFPSTYDVPVENLIHLLDNMLDACLRHDARVAVVEVADGFLQQETRGLFESEEFRSRVRGVILAASCSGSALCAADYTQRSGFDVWAVSGLITNSPLFIREFTNHSDVAVIRSRSDRRLADLVLKKTGRPEVPEAPAAVTLAG